MDETSDPRGGPDPASDGAARAAPGGPAGYLLKASFLTGSAALLLAMATDFVAVACRHLHISLIGAIEVIQACVVVTISAGLVAATLTGAHAAVHLVTERLPPAWRERLARGSAVLGFIAFTALCFGDGWLLYDTRDWNERSDLLGLPIWPLRLIWTLSLAVVAVLFVVRAIRGAPGRPAGETRP